MVNGDECDTYEWMNNNLWKVIILKSQNKLVFHSNFLKELIEATKQIFQINDTISKFSDFEPTTSSTQNLKLAYILKENLIKTHIVLEPSRSNKGNI